jgi:hypothetical protein
MMVRGYGPVKDTSVVDYHRQLEDLLARFDAASITPARDLVDA